MRAIRYRVPFHVMLFGPRSLCFNPLCVQLDIEVGDLFGAGDSTESFNPLCVQLDIECEKGLFSCAVLKSFNPLCVQLDIENTVDPSSDARSCRFQSAMRAIRYRAYLWKHAPDKGFWRKNRRFGIFQSCQGTLY